MKKPTAKKLSLNKESVRNLTQKMLVDVVGGVVTRDCTVWPGGSGGCGSQP